ncbi:MAG: hypothetical protein JNK15_14355 [Planctomycetes bacterium]|nr:hypothetical protein [Planctomycetota bacterium]
MSRTEPDAAQAPAGITCDNCGAKWRLPPAWKGPTANCQRCGCTIDAHVQLDPGRARSLAAARPAQDRARASAAPRTTRPAGRAGTTPPRAPAPAAAADDRARSARDERRGGTSPFVWIFAACSLAVLGAIVFVANR